MTKSFFQRSGWIIAMSLAFQISASGAELPGLSELLEILDKNAPEFSETELDQAAIEGIIAHSDGKLRLVDETQETNGLLDESSIYEEKYLHLRVKNFDQNLANAISREIESRKETSSIAGLVLDLRYADGPAYEEVVPVANLFSDSGKPVLELDGEMRSLQNSGSRFNLPVILLTSARTRHAAEAFAAAMRLADAAVLVGSNTAGMAFSYHEFEMSDGRRLQIGGERLKLGDGTVLGDSGVSPDIRVSIDPEDEAQWYDDPFLRLNGEPVRRARLNEADLVRQRNALFNGSRTLEESLPGDGSDLEPVRTIQDPSLARGIDLLKGLVLLKHLRQP